MKAILGSTMEGVEIKLGDWVMLLPWVTLDGRDQARFADAHLHPWRVVVITHGSEFGVYEGVSQLEVQRDDPNHPGDVLTIKVPDAGVELDAASLMTAVMRGERP